MRIGKIMAVAMVAFCIVAGASTAMSFTGSEERELSEKSDSLTQQYELYDMKKMYEEAADCLKKISDLYPNDTEKLERYIGYCYDKGFGELYYTACQKAEQLEPYNYNAAERVLTYMLDNENKSIYKKLHAVMDRFSSDKYPTEHDNLTKLYNSIRGDFRQPGSAYETVSCWQNGYAVVSTKDGWEVLDSTGEQVVVSPLGKIYSYSPREKLIAVVHEGQLVYTNFSGARKRVPFDTENRILENHKYLGSMSCGLATIEFQNGSWGYLIFSGDSIVTYASGFQMTTNLSGNIGALKQNGKWAFFSFENGSVNMLTGYDYDDVYTDKQGCSVFDGIAFAKKAGSSMWSMLRFEKPDPKEKDSHYTAVTVSENMYTEVTPFNGNASVKTANGNWNIIDSNAAVLYTNSNNSITFGESGCGLTAFKSGGKWGYVDTAGNMIIKPQFDEACGFNSSGAAFVKTEGVWSLIRLKEYIFMEE